MTRTRVVMAAWVAAMVMPALAAASGKTVYRSVDPVSGAEVRVLQGTGSEVTIEVREGDLLITKQFSSARLKTTVATRLDRFAVAVDAMGMRIESGKATIAVPVGRREGLEEIRNLARTSPAVARATKLIGEARWGASPVAHSLMVTRAMLLSLGDHPNATTQVAQWAQSTRAAGSTTRIGMHDSPTECWNDYAKEAIAAWMEMEDCYRNAKWYEFWERDACQIIYDLRAIGAFSWWVKCVSLS